MAQTSAAITNPEAFVEGNLPVLFDIEDIVQSACISSEDADIAAEQCEIPAELVARMDGPAVKVSGIKRRDHMQDSHRCIRESSGKLQICYKTSLNLSRSVEGWWSSCALRLP